MHFRLNRVNIIAPLAQSFNFKQVIQVLTPLCFNNINLLFSSLYNKIRIVVRYCPFGIAIIYFKMHGKKVFCIGNNIIASIKKTGELKLKMAVPNDFIKDALFRNQIALFFNNKRPAFADFYIIPYLRLTLIKNGQFVNLFLKNFYNSFRCLNLG